jgi:hypothetical protein
MKHVTTASVAYVATQVIKVALLALPLCHVHVLLQVRFSLTSSPVFSRTDTQTDSKNFYTSVLDLLDDPDEDEEVKDLLSWWNR